MKRMLVTIVIVSGLIVLSGTVDSADCQHRFGGGIHYLRTLGEIKDEPEWDSNAVGFILSYQYVAAEMLKIEGDIEIIPDFGGTKKTLFQPQAWIILGSWIYGGAGIGGNYFDGEWLDDPFYGFRLGVDLHVGQVGLDCFATYRFLNTKVLEEIDEEDLDSITFGVVVRFGR